MKGGREADGGPATVAGAHFQMKGYRRTPPLEGSERRISENEKRLAQSQAETIAHNRYHAT
jgi:hypothetical protein